MPEWEDAILTEKTGTIRESAGKRVDVLIVHNSIPPVAVETSVTKDDADCDAKSRLGTHYVENGREIQTAIAVDLDKSDVDRTYIDINHVMRYALHQQGYRFPPSGFMTGDVHDLARLITTTAIPKEEMERVADFVASKVKAAANILEPKIKYDDLKKISETLYQRSALKGLRTTMVLWLNALLVQQRLYGSDHDIPIRTDIPNECVAAWRIIHGINWRAIFEPAIDILDKVRMMALGETAEALKLLNESVECIAAAKLGVDVNIGAELFPKMAADRKESAAFYTQPATAEMLAALTIIHDMADWSDPNIFEWFRIADMTCGTGTLLRFGYRRVKQYHSESDSPDHTTLHKIAMENGLIGTDVSPIAAHLTSTSLAVETDKPYGDTKIGWVGVGNENRTGAIEYMKKDTIEDLMMDTIGLSTGKGKDVSYNSVTVRKGMVDVILMNPPYSRTRGGQSAFNIAGLLDKERDACQKRWGELIKGEPCSKTAGMAATFLCIAQKKVKRGGRIGFVLPRTVAFADTWANTRKMIEENFEDVMVVAVAAGKALGRSAFSADTKMEEILLVATRKNVDDGACSPIKCTTLHEPVTRLGEAAAIAGAIQDTADGPVIIGEEVGVVKTFRADEGRPWSYVGTIHDTVAVIANDLAEGRLRDVVGNHILDIPMTTLGKLFMVGKSHDSIGHLKEKDPRGAFVFHEVTSDTDAVGRYRSLWKADAKTQTKMTVLPTHKGTPHTSKADDIWATRSTLFYSRGMRWNTQSIVAATTTQEVMGGRAWTSLQHKDKRVMKAFALWANSTYGMMVHWTRGSRTHPGRSPLQVGGIGKVPCPDFGQFGDDVLNTAAAEFDRLSRMELCPAYMTAVDDTRAEINHAVSHMLDIPNYDTRTLARAWGAEPSVRGSKESPDD